MTEDVKADKIKKAQEALSKLIKKPPLTDKLLRKPPFRFLHDIVTSVMRETGFLEAVYSPDELNSDNIKDRQAKINFLDKLIANIKSVTGSSVSAKPSKIIAGLEVNKTLDLLIALAKAVDIKLNGVKISEKGNTKKQNENKDSKKTSPSTKEEKSDVNNKKRQDSQGKESKRKTQTKTKISDKNKAEPNKAENKTDKQNKTVEYSLPHTDNPDPVQQDTQEKIIKTDGGPQENELGIKQEENVAFPSERPPSHRERPPSHRERPPSHRERPPSHRERPPSHRERPPSHRERPPSADTRYLTRETKSGERQSSSRQSSMDIASSHDLQNTCSIDKDKSFLESSVEAEMEADRKPRLPGKVAIEQIVQNSTDSTTNSILSTEPSDKVNETTTSQHNLKLEEVEGSEKGVEMKRKVEERNHSSDHHRHNPQQLATSTSTPASTSTKMNRPQTAKTRPPSSRQRRREESGQVVLGQGESVDVMGSAAVTAPSSKGRRMLSGRPMSARPGAPKPKDRGQVANTDTSSGLDEVKPILLIEDNKDNDDDDDNLVTLEKEAAKDGDDEKEGVELKLDEGNEGALVSQILQTKKELEQMKKPHWHSPYPQTTPLEIDWEARTKSRRDVLSKEVRSLCEGIQTVTRSSNPLGKLFDFLQEDVELMQSELLDCTKTSAQLHREIHLQTKETEEVLSPLRKQLADLDLLIEHEHQSIRRLKSNIYLNTTKLDNLLNINSPH